VNGERPPLTRSTTTLIGAGVFVAASLVFLSVFALIDREKTRRREATLGQIAEICAMFRELPRKGRGELWWKVSQRQTVSQGETHWRDAWNRPILMRLPGQVHKRGFDFWSVGPNGIDESGAGDDVLGGEDW
jgi:hypothetical protein